MAGGSNGEKRLLLATEALRLAVGVGRRPGIAITAAPVRLILLKDVCFRRAGRDRKRISSGDSGRGGEEEGPPPSSVAAADDS